MCHFWMAVAGQIGHKISLSKAPSQGPSRGRENPIMSKQLQQLISEQRREQQSERRAITSKPMNGEVRREPCGGGFRILVKPARY